MPLASSIISELEVLFPFVPYSLQNQNKGALGIISQEQGYIILTLLD